MINTYKTIIITPAVPVFLLLLAFKYFYGKIRGKRNYILSDTFASLGLCLISRFSTLLNLGSQ